MNYPINHLFIIFSKINFKKSNPKDNTLGAIRPWLCAVLALGLISINPSAMAALDMPNPLESLEKSTENVIKNKVQQATEELPRKKTPSDDNEISPSLEEAYKAHQTEVLKEKIKKDTIDQLTVNINTADIATLTLLEGIGLSRAQAIIDYREQNGVFRSVEELARVKGIGQRLLEKNRSRIILE